MTGANSYNMSICTDTTANGERKHSIWKPNGKWNSITYAPGINEEDRFIIDIAFKHLYCNSGWFQGMCDMPAVGIYVRNGLHFSGNDTQPHITFQFRGCGNFDVDNTYYHAFVKGKVVW